MTEPGGPSLPKPGLMYWYDRAAALQKALEDLLAMLDDADYLPSDDEWKVIVAARAAAVDRSEG